MVQWGFLRETCELASKAGKDKDTNLPRTGLEDYLRVIFPNVTDWVHDKTTGLQYPTGEISKRRPDYRSETLKMIIEYDGLPHYQDPSVIIKDAEGTKFYEDNGYKVVRIPYFIQLTQNAVKQMFSICYPNQLFDPKISSIGPKGKNTPAYLCVAGITRMAKEFSKYPEQYEVNLNYLKSCNKDEFYLTRYDLLELEYNKLTNK